ncbi:Gx transporter family protein [Aerococcaceae bacterium WGS1372]
MKRSRYQIMVYIAMLSAQAVIISILEGAIPSPLSFAPGAKLGLANLITIIAIFTLPMSRSIQVVCLRIILTALIGGNTSTFFYSLAGGLLSYVAMLLSKQLGPKRVSIIGISILGGVMHNIGQLSVAALFARSFSVMNYLPILSISGILAGFVVGFIGNLLLERISILRVYHEELVQSSLQSNWLKANSLTKES